MPNSQPSGFVFDTSITPQDRGSVLVVGPVRSGKSTALRYFREKISKRNLLSHEITSPLSKFIYHIDWIGEGSFEDYLEELELFSVMYTNWVLHPLDQWCYYDDTGAFQFLEYYPSIRDLDIISDDFEEKRDEILGYGKIYSFDYY
jgi:hypothetical protein